MSHPVYINYTAYNFSMKFIWQKLQGFKGEPVFFKYIQNMIYTIEIKGKGRLCHLIILFYLSHDLLVWPHTHRKSHVCRIVLWIITWIYICLLCLWCLGGLSTEVNISELLIKERWILKTMTFKNTSFEEKEFHICTVSNTHWQCPEIWKLNSWKLVFETILLSLFLTAVIAKVNKRRKWHKRN